MLVQSLRGKLIRFPQWFQELIPKLARISRRLRREREPSMYGDEESGTPPEELYDGEDAKEALSWALEVFEIVTRLFRELTGKNHSKHF